MFEPAQQDMPVVSGSVRLRINLGALRGGYLVTPNRDYCQIRVTGATFLEVDFSVLRVPLNGVKYVAQTPANQRRLLLEVDGSMT